jgi:uncharacterized protein (TIGR02118 family)
MAKLVALYNPPRDSAGFDAYYVPTHIPLARKVPGVTKVEVSTGPVMTPEGPAPYHVVGILSFDSMASLQAGLASPEGQAAVADLANFASGGATILVFESQEP